MPAHKTPPLSRDSDPTSTFYPHLFFLPSQLPFPIFYDFGQCHFHSKLSHPLVFLLLHSFSQPNSFPEPAAPAMKIR